MMNKSRTLRRVLIWALLMAAVTACWAQEYVLQQKYQEGETRSYKIVFGLEFSGDLIPGGKLVIGEERIQHWKVQKVYPDGSAEVMITHSDIHLKQNNEEIPLSALDGLSFAGMPLDVPLIQTVTKIGTTREIKPTRELRPSQKAKAESLFDLLTNVKAVWPEKPVEPGYTWKDQVTISQDAPGVGSVDISIDIAFTFEGIETCGEVKCLKVTAVGSGAGALGDGAGTVEMKTDTNTLINLKDGRLVKHVDGWSVLFKVVTESGEQEMRETFEQVQTLESPVESKK